MLFFKAILTFENRWFTVNNQQSLSHFIRVTILALLSEVFVIRSHFCSYIQFLKLLFFFSHVNTYCTRFPTIQKKIPILRSITALLGILWWSNLNITRTNGTFGGQEGGVKQILQNSDKLLFSYGFFFWSNTLRKEDF